MATFTADGFTFTSNAKREPTHVVILTELDGDRGIYSKHSSLAGAEKSKKDRERPYYIRVASVDIFPVTRIS